MLVDSGSKHCVGIVAFGKSVAYGAAVPVLTRLVNAAFAGALRTLFPPALPQRACRMLPTVLDARLPGKNALGSPPLKLPVLSCESVKSGTGLEEMPCLMRLPS